MPYLVTADTPGRVHTATIALSGSLSGAVAIPYTHTLVGLVMPTAWDTADLTFQGSFDGTTYANLYTDGGTEVNVPAAAGRSIYVNTAELRAYPYLKIRSGTQGTPVAQTAARVITLISHP